MSFEFVTAAGDLEDYLKAELPASWLIQDAEKPLGKTRGIVLTHSQGNVTDDAVGTALPVACIGVEFNLEISTPETDAVKGLPRLNAAVVHLFRAIDAHPQLVWTGATRGRTSAGESIYTVPVTVISTY